MYELVIEQQMKILIEKCLSFYKETLAKSKTMWNEDNLHVYHDLSISKALMMFKEMKKMGNSSHEKKFKAQLEAAIEKLNIEWRDQTVKSLRQAREEKAKIEKALEEKRAMERQAIENERLAKAKQEELERERQLRKLEEERFESQRRQMEQRSLAMSRPSPSMGFDMSEMFRELQSASFRGYSGSSYAAPSMSARMQCQGTTLQGRQCRNMARPGSSRCHHNH